MSFGLYPGFGSLVFASSKAARMLRAAVGSHAQQARARDLQWQPWGAGALSIGRSGWGMPLEGGLIVAVQPGVYLETPPCSAN
jgi:hypothetical protein